MTLSRSTAKISLFLTTAAALVLASIGISAPALAVGGTPVTSFTASPTTIRSGDYFDFTVNGNQDPNSAVDTFNGCYVYWVNDVDVQQNFTGNSINLPTSTFFHDNFPNYGATNDTYRFAGWTGETCSDALLETTPDMDTGILTVTPQLVIDNVALTAGTAIIQASFPYSVKSATGTSPYAWSAGGIIEAETDEEALLVYCDMEANTLPSGVTITTTASSGGQAPSLTLAGTPAAGSEGTYKTCMRLEGFAEEPTSYAIMTITVAAPPIVEPELAKTGSTDISLAGLASLGLVMLGGAAVLLRRRKA